MKFQLKLQLLFMLLLFSLTAGAQESDSLLKTQQLKIGFKVLGPSLTYERKLSKYYTLYTELSVEYASQRESYLIITPNSSGSYDATSVTNNYNFFYPQITTEGRRYYHFNQRQEKKKDIGNNSANFFSVGASLGGAPFSTSENIAKGKLFLVAGKWGIQRVVSKKFSLEFDLGAGYQYWSINKKWNVVPAGNFKLGFIVK